MALRTLLAPSPRQNDGVPGSRGPATGQLLVRSKKVEAEAVFTTVHPPESPAPCTCIGNIYILEASLTLIYPEGSDRYNKMQESK